MRSTSAEDISAFDAPIDLNDAGLGADVYNYPQCYKIANGNLLLLYRYGGFAVGNWYYRTSSDNGATWGSSTLLVDFTNGTYVISRQSTSDADNIVCGISLATAATP